MKKILTLLAVLTLAFGATACEQTKSETSSGSTTEAKVETPPKQEEDYTEAMLSVVDEVCSETGASSSGRTAQMVRDGVQTRVETYGSVVSPSVNETGIVWEPACDGKTNPDEVLLSLYLLAKDVDPAEWTQKDINLTVEMNETMGAPGEAVGRSYWLAPGNIVVMEQRVTSSGYSSDAQTREALKAADYTQLGKL